MKVFENETFDNDDEIRYGLNDSEFIECTFNGCNYTGEIIIGCCFERCNFSDCNLSNIVYKKCDMSDCAFSGCKILGCNWNIFEKKYSLTYPFSKLEKCNLQYNNFTDLKIKSFNFLQCNLSDASFINCNLEKSVFSECNLNNCMFEQNNLSNCDFRTAHKYYINMATNYMKKAKFSYPEVVNLLLCTGIEIENLNI